MEFFISASFFIRVFFIFASFFRHPFFQLFYGATRPNPDGPGSCASHSDSQISLSYLMAVFSTNSFRLFLKYSKIYTYQYILKKEVIICMVIWVSIGHTPFRGLFSQEAITFFTHSKVPEP